MPILRTGIPQQYDFTRGNYIPDDFDSQALGIIQHEKTQWEEMPVNVTRKVQYLMRNVIELARRYYAGVFDNPFDEVTGDRKTWVPMTETAVQAVVKSIDLDTKDILISPAKQASSKVIPMIRAAILNLFKQLDFGQLLNDMTSAMARDGTVVIKTDIVIDPNTKEKKIKSRIVNLLNFWVDPSADSIKDSSVIERAIYTRAEVQAYADVWDNTDEVSYTNMPDRLTDISNVLSSAVDYTEIWERWGLIPKSLVTKNSKDKDTIIEGHIIASGINSPKVIHLIRENPRKDGKKPYEECWYRRIDGRWPGRGVAEMLFGLQEYVNEIVNTRRSNNKLLQNGIFLIRKGSGITPDMLNTITAGGGLPVTNINNDIKQLQVQDFRQSSYTDEDRVQIMADRVTGAFDIGRGEVTRASSSATSTLAREQSIRDTFVLVQENIGLFIERLIRYHYLPLMKEIMTEDDFIKITGDTDYLKMVDDLIIETRKEDFIKKRTAETGFYPEQAEIDQFIGDQSKYLKSQGKQRFIKYFRNIFDIDVDVEVNVTNEKFDKVVAVQQLRDALISFSRLPTASKLDTDAVFREMFNIMGLEAELFLEKPQVPALAQDISQTGRLLKQLPGGLPNAQTSFENASKLPQQQAPAPMGGVAPGELPQ